MKDYRTQNTPGVIYFAFVERLSLVKVGRTGNLRPRLANLKCCHGYGSEVRLLATVPVQRAVDAETLVHRHLRPLCVKGREWYRMTEIEIEATCRFIVSNEAANGNGRNGKKAS